MKNNGRRLVLLGNKSLYGLWKNIVKSEPMFIYHVAFLGHIEPQNVSNAQTKLDQAQAAQSLLQNKFNLPPPPHAESEMPLNRCT